MRRLLLILMIALLPVRAWASDVMTVASAAQALNATENVATYALSTRATAHFNSEIGTTLTAGMPFDCPLLAQVVRNPAQDKGGNPFKPLCHGCNTCQLCMALVTGYPMVQVSAARLPQAVQHLAAISFTSAERAPGFKPPIS